MCVCLHVHVFHKIACTKCIKQMPEVGDQNDLKIFKLRKPISEENNHQKWSQEWAQRNNDQSLTLKMIHVMEFGVSQVSPAKVQLV